jgi:uncharacterized protein with HEPN domain
MRNKVIMEKLLGYTEKILAYCKGETYSSFVMDTKLVEACVFNLSQMGELCRAVDDDFAQNHAEIPWREMYGLRNRIVHDYEGVNMCLVWDIIRDDLPELSSLIRTALSDI